MSTKVLHHQDTKAPRKAPRKDLSSLEKGLRADLVVEQRAIVEIKSVEHLLPVHEAQLLTYLKLTHKRLGFLPNFNATLMKHGIHHRVL